MFVRSYAAAGLLFAALAIFAFSAAAEATAYNTFVSATGVDTRPCTVQAQPCKTLQRAVAVTGAGGTIRILSDLSSNVSITKSLTIEGGGNSVIGFISINSASAVVILRELHLNGRGAVASGISIVSAAAVHIEDSTVERYTSDGIKFIATTATKLFLSRTVSHANGSDGLYADAVNAQVVIKDSGFEQNVSTGAYLKVAKGSVTGSDASGNGQYGFILLSPRMEVTETTADYNSLDGFVVRPPTQQWTILNSAEATGNGGYGLHVESGGAALMNNCVFVANPGGGSDGVLNQGTLLTRNNNIAMGYTGTAAATWNPN